MKISYIWLLEILACWALLFAIQIPLRRNKHRVIRTIIFILKLLLIPAIALLFVAIECRLSYRHGDILCAAYVALIGDSAASIIEFVIRKVKSIGGSEEDKHSCIQSLIAALSLAGCVALTAYGAVNAWSIHMVTHDWKAEGLAGEHTFAFVADIHAGSAQSVDKVAELVDQINSENPEFVILGGDVTDELTTYDDMLATYKNLSALKAPTYFIYGNHDRQPDWDYFGSRTYTDEQLEETIKSSGITILSDEYVQLADDLVMLGREDVSMTDLRKDWKTLKNPYAGKGALIVADHQPYDNEQLAVEDSVLQLSGHTHAGQMWPLQKIYRLAGRQAYGEFEYPGTMLYVTAGESDWMMPLRTEEHCEWDLVTIRL